MTPDEQQLAQQLAAEAITDLEAAGFITPCATITDLTLRQARALAGVLVALSSWWPGPMLEHSTLGDVLKVVPAETAEHVQVLLHWGGFLDDDLVVPDD